MVVNIRGFAGGFHGGIPRYIQEVLDRLDVPIRPIAPPASIASGPLGHAWEQAALPLRSRNALLWSPANFGPLAIEHQVVSIYDLSPIDHPEWFGHRYAQAFSWLVPRLAHRSRHIITISEFSANRMVDLWQLDSSKITIAEPGVSDTFAADPSVERNNDLVAIAGSDPRKNRQRILDAWEHVRQERPSSTLIVVGGRRPDGVFAGVEYRDRPQVHYVDDPTDLELRDLYRSAERVIFAPLYEGYGIPAAEALACGAPLVTSAISALGHAHASAATLVDPSSTSDLADAMMTPVTETPHQVKARSWSDTAATIRQVLLDHV